MKKYCHFNFKSHAFLSATREKEIHAGRYVGSLQRHNMDSSVISLATYSYKSP